MRTTHIVINPRFKQLEKFIHELPTNFESSGNIVYDARNQIREYSISGINIAVKRYKIPHLFSRLDYTFFRSSKARRAFDYSLKLSALGFETPEPIAYIEIKNNGLFERGYFANRMIEANTIRQWDQEPKEEFNRLVREFAIYTGRLHEKGVFHLDYSPGNVLYKKENDQYKFYLIDLNRMRFNIKDKNLLMCNFERITSDNELLKQIVEEYAKAQKLDINQTLSTVFAAKSRFESKQIRKQRFKKLLK